MNRQTWKVAALLFGSGTCALIYQTTWLRAFRMIFGASTFATAAVLAIFLGGLGLGSARLGRRADSQSRPLRFYGQLELLIALTAAISPLLLWLIAKIYIATGGSVTLGTVGATVVRLLLSILVLGAPTILMGGTLPAAARAVETADDPGRRKLALLYALNTLGAVTGTLLTTFYLLEHFGNRKTLFVAVVINIVIAVVALMLPSEAAELSAPEHRDAEPAQKKKRKGVEVDATLTPADSVFRTAVPAQVVLAASAIVGFAFLLMELVWYRMLGPLLGGTTFTFGLILATALLGIGLGGAAYSLLRTGAPTAGSFALTCSLEAVLIIIPFALGDRLAIVANLLRNLGRIGFAGNVMAWSVLTVVTVLPAAFISGIQFPLLMALLGRGREDVGRQVGQAYAWNTIGAIVGSLSGGFGLIPLLSATGCWKLVAIVLAVSGIVATFFALRAQQRWSGALAILVALVAIGGTFSTGPTAVWRHSGIGAGRAPQPESSNGLRDWMTTARRTTMWESDGRESSVAVGDIDDLSFFINGKGDGSARGDDGTQVMSGLIGAVILPKPQRSLVIGLGTGSTAGWLAAVPTMERVDVVELEPAVLRVARDMAAVNQSVMKNPKVKMHIGDAREVLLTSREQYDIIFSEPSNPYRAGIASLFTREFYEATASRLQRGGVFLQWVQAYDIDASTVRSVYATITSVFPHVDTWLLGSGDLLLVATPEPIIYDIERIRTRLAEQPYRQALQATWRVETAEGFFSHFIGGETLALDIGRGAELNTDDKTSIEFSFARKLGDKSLFSVNDLLRATYTRPDSHPARQTGVIDWKQAVLQRSTDVDLEAMPPEASDEYVMHREFAKAISRADFPTAARNWRQQQWQVLNSGEAAGLASALALDADEDAARQADQLGTMQPIERDALLAILRERQGRGPEAVDLFERAFVSYRSDPWPDNGVTGRALDSALRLAYTNRALAVRLAEAISQPFAGGAWNDARRIYYMSMRKSADGCGATTIAALRALEPDFPWRGAELRTRRDCYATLPNDPLAERSQREFEEYNEAQPPQLLPAQ